MTASISPLVISLFRFSISSVAVLVVCGFPEMHTFLLDCLIYWHIAAPNTFLKIICISLVFVVISSLS